MVLRFARNLDPKIVTQNPESLVGAERVFSQLNLIKTKNRNRLNVTTCEALLHTKQLVSNVKCINFQPAKNFLTCNLRSKNVEKPDETEEIADILF
ncbi:hypothetical protein TcasGA2_TC010086 [Tribolium castaneum]|uniref:HAT C-terminal dimerisation domain-containing protein n=1 Tax=Tribolium castaneum TaxID=7070 RepID=D6WS79_TRICA|nr:hypothetical protein TcasGA2_TC010086 [Tribolium castaneum]